MQHNQAVYAAAIQQSADSLQRYFAATEPAVQQMADELLVLSALQVSLPLLAPLKSPQLFAAYQQGQTDCGVGIMIRLALLIRNPWSGDVIGACAGESSGLCHAGGGWRHH